MLWVFFAFGCLYLCQQACTTGDETDIENQSVGAEPVPPRIQHEYAVIVDPAGSIRVGVKNLFSRSMQKLSGVTSSSNLSQADTDNRETLISNNGHTGDSA